MSIIKHVMTCQLEKFTEEVKNIIQTYELNEKDLLIDLIQQKTNKLIKEYYCNLIEVEDKNKIILICDYLINKKLIIRILRDKIEMFYGASCCKDKAVFLYDCFYNYYFFNQKINFSEYSIKFQLPKTCSETDWLSFIESIFLLSIGQPQKYIIEEKKLNKKHFQTIKSFEYIKKEISQQLEYLLNHNTYSDEIFFSVPDMRFKNREIILLERAFNKELCSEILNLLKTNLVLTKSELVEKIKLIKDDSKNLFPKHPSMTMGEHFQLQENMDRGIEYYDFLDKFNNYQNIYFMKEDFLNKLMNCN